MLSCKEVTRRLGSDEFADTKWWQRLPVHLHLLMCRHCRRFARQLRAIGDAARQKWGQHADDSLMTDDVRRRLLERCLGESDHPSNPRSN